METFFFGWQYFDDSKAVKTGQSARLYSDYRFPTTDRDRQYNGSRPFE